VDAPDFKAAAGRDEWRGSFPQLAQKLHASSLMWRQLVQNMTNSKPRAQVMYQWP
jgi:hypothetical protein